MIFLIQNHLNFFNNLLIFKIVNLQLEMKHFFVKISSILLAFLVLFSTFSFTVEKHYCGDFLMDVSFTGDAKDCGMDMEAKALRKKKSCCKDEMHKVEGQDELQLTSFDKITFEKQQFLTAFFYSYQNIFLVKKPENFFQKTFPPPEVYQNYQIIYQSFLI